MIGTAPRAAWKIALGAVALAFAGGLPSTPAAAADFTMKFGTATFNESQHEFIKFYKEALEKASGGRIEVKIHPRSELGPIPRMIDGLQLGTIEAYIGPADFYVGVDPRFGVFSTPMLFKNNDHASATVLDPALNDEMLNLGVPKGIVGLGTFGLGSSNYAAKSPIMRLADFSGKKLRVNATAMEREKMKRLGATAVPMPLNEVLPSLQRGVIDGTMSGTSIFVAFKFNDVVKVVTITNDTMLVSLAVASKVWLDKLPADLRKMVIDVGRQTQVKTHKWEQQFSKTLEAKWKEMGGQMHTLPPEDLAKMKTLLSSVGDDVSKDQPAVLELLKKVRAVAAKH
ncbi:MAG: TRAP transporter substrate-binding protein [Xanthobacteraceae bacterium]